GPGARARRGCGARGERGGTRMRGQGRGGPRDPLPRRRTSLDKRGARRPRFQAPGHPRPFSGGPPDAGRLPGARRRPLQAARPRRTRRLRRTRRAARLPRPSAPRTGVTAEIRGPQPAHHRGWHDRFCRVRDVKRSVCPVGAGRSGPL
ncbi:MAG: hypothetical protein AVDCRST_MAG01-01-3372, partial [uncultured Rubrobacteraceae bacterium]